MIDHAFLEGNHATSQEIQAILKVSQGGCSNGVVINKPYLIVYLFGSFDDTFSSRPGASDLRNVVKQLK